LKLETGNSKKVVITGGAGFIGSHIAEECVSRGWQVTILDDLSSGSLKNIQHLLGTQNSKLGTGNSSRPSCPTQGESLRNPSPETSNVELQTEIDFVQGSITNLELLQNLFHGAHYVFHQAAIPSVPRSIDNPLASHEANVNGTLNVLIAARDNQVKKLVFASSSAIYGDTPTLPKHEDMPPNPQSPYAAYKLAAETYCVVFNKVYGLPTACLRYFNVYGPRQNPDSQYAAVIPKFIRSIMEGQSPIIFGDGEQSRDFTFVKDVVSANILAAESAATGVFNIGRGERTTLNQLARMILKLMIEPGNPKLKTENSSSTPSFRPEESVARREDLARNLKLVYQKDRAGDVKHSLADITKARTFGYNPQYTIEKGIIETIKSFGG